MDDKIITTIILVFLLLGCSAGMKNKENRTRVEQLACVASAIAGTCGIGFGIVILLFAQHARQLHDMGISQ